MFHFNEGFWSAGQTFAAWIAVFVNVVGIVFIWKQLGASREAVDRAAESAKAATIAASVSLMSTRPWMAIDVEERAFFRDDGEQQFVNVKFSFKNVGSTPAIRMQSHFDLRLVLNQILFRF